MKKKVSQPLQIIAASVQPFAAAAGGALPARLLICPWGRTETNKGPVICDAFTAQSLPQFQKKYRRQRVPLDYEHGTLSGQEPQKVAGFGTVEIVPGEGIFLSNIEWMPEAAEYASHYGGISPAISRDEQGRVYFVHSAGFVRNPEMDLKIFSAAMPEEAGAEPSTPNQPETQSPRMKAAALKLLARHGVALGEDATDDQISAAIEALPEPQTEQQQQQPPEGFSAKPPPWAVQLQSQVAELGKAVIIQKTAEEARQKEAHIDAAKRAGKVIPFSAAVIGLLTPEQLKAELDAVKPTLPVQRETAGVDAFGAAHPPAGELSAEELRMAKAMGVDPDKLKATPRV